MTLTIQELQGLRAWFRGVGTPDLRTQDKDDIYLALDELLAYREGYDPAERLPEPGAKVLVQSKAGGLDSASIRVWADTGEQMWQGRGWSAPIGYARRWYPLPGGE